MMMTDDELIDQVRRAAYVHFGKTDLLALEELLRRFKRAKKEGEPKPAPVSANTD